MIDVVAFLLAVAVVAAGGFVLWLRLRGPGATAAWALRAAACLIVAFVGVGFGSWRLTNARTIQLAGDIVPRVATGDSVIAITFDDGPLPGPTEQILAALAAEDVRATFFLIGSAMQQHPDEARRIVDAGHEVGNHSFTHPMMLGLPLRRIRDEVERTDEQIRLAGHVGPIHFRSPYGKKFVALPYYLARTGRSNIFWDVEPETFPDVARDPDRILEHVLANVRPGSIILLHVMSRHYEPSLQAVPAILAALKARGYRFVTVSELLALAT